MLINKRSLLIVAVLVLAGMSCKLLFPGETSLQATEQPVSAGEQPQVEGDGRSQGQLGEIIFCEEVTDAGECLGQSDQFPQGTQVVYALFTYQGMVDGQPWGQLWENDGDVSVDDRQLTWEDGEAGWLSYEYREQYALGGNYTLSLYLGDELVQQASFEVDPPEAVQESSDPSFGQIDFTTQVSEDQGPLEAATEFSYGDKKIYGFFPYSNIPDGQAWSCEWLYNGEQLVRVDLSWDKGSQGSTYCSYENSGGSVLQPGEYTLNLYMDDQTARSASATIRNPDYQADNVPWATPEDVVSPELMKGWEMINNASFEPVHYFAQIALKYHIKIQIDENMTWYGGVYHVDDCSAQPREPGVISFSRKVFNDSPWETIAALMAHELVHGSQHMEKGQCGCFIYNEVQAYEAQIYTYKALGHEDMVYSQWGDVFDSNGRFDQDLLWRWVDDRYDCPSYAP